VRRLLLTGAAGGIAAAVRPVLRELAGEVVLTDREEPAGLTAGERFVPADLADPAPWEALAAGCDAIVHLGAVADEAPFEVLAGQAWPLPASGRQV
jgi:uronate dehydrogenase